MGSTIPITEVQCVVGIVVFWPITSVDQMGEFSRLPAHLTEVSFALRILSYTLNCTS